VSDADLRRATDPACSAWVSANAGSGKTHLLTDRVTRLLLAGAKPERILCLTYTKAAASEMASRLFDRLGGWALLPDDALARALAKIGETDVRREQLAKARRLFAQALETPGGLKIQTIHSFCQHVLTRFPVEAGVSPRFSVLDERSAAELMEMARTEVLELAEQGDARLAAAVALLATRAADGRFAEILDLAITHADKLRARIAHHGGIAPLFVHLRATLGVSAEDSEDAIVTKFCAALAGERAMVERVHAWLVGGGKTDRGLAECVEAFLNATGDAEKHKALSELFLTTTNGPRKRLASKPLQMAEPGLVTFLDGFQQRFVAMEERRKGAAIAALTEALVTVACAVLEIYGRLKCDRAALDYDDLIAKTRALIERAGAAAWVLYKLDGGLDHILVDEAQDTSPEQWEIVAKLADEFFAGEGARQRANPRTLFAVGDEKQSIFSFQGADPEAFGYYRSHFKAKARAADLCFIDLRPAVSRRSGVAVLEFVDGVFANADARDGLTTHSDPIRHDPYRADPARVEIWPLTKPPADPEPDPWDAAVDAPSKGSAGAILAARIAETVAGWLREGVCVPGTKRAVTPGDIMILVRRRSAFSEEMIHQLRERNIEVAGADRMVLLDQIAILDLVAMGRFALLPEDDLNLAALLKSPLIGLSESELYDLAHQRDGTLWQALVARQADARYGAAHIFLARALADADYLAPFEFYARVLSAGVRKRLIAPLGGEAADAIDEFLALALAHESQHPPSLESFLDWFEAGASDVKRDMERTGGAVRVMTVHGAKGLEADVVILPDTAQIPDHERHAGLLFTEDCVFFGVSQAHETEAVAAAKADAHRREMREYRRLLYVALTRARDWLVLCGYENKTKLPDSCWYPHLERAVREAGKQERVGDKTIFVLGAPLMKGAPAAAISAGAQRLPDFLAFAAAPEKAPQILRPFDAAGMDEFSISPVAEYGADRFRRGLLVHALLSRLPDVAPDEREAVARRYLAREGVAAEDRIALIEETLAVLRDARFAPLFSPTSRAEVAIAASLPELGGKRVSGQIDRLAVTDVRVLAADFKTNRPPPDSPEKTPRLYVAQMALYRAALARIYTQRRIECVLIWTDGPKLTALPPDLLDAEIARIAHGAGGAAARVHPP
jgi:ATP-dependent helicase/nuclease subunit A